MLLSDVLASRELSVTSSADLPEANDLTMGIMALAAQQEREAISKRTREALSVARSRGGSWATPMEQRRSGRLARAVRRCARPSPAAPIGRTRKVKKVPKEKIEQRVKDAATTLGPENLPRS